MMPYTLLYAEDDRDMAELNIQYLKKLGYTILYAENGEEALALYESRNPDLLLLDVVMPIKDGFTLAREIRVKDRQTPILFISALSGTDDVVRGFKLGANDYIRKDADPQEMAARIVQALRACPKLRGNLKITEHTYLDVVNRSVVSCGETYVPHFREYNLAYFLAVNINVVHTRDFIISNVWGDSDFNANEYLSKAVTNIRRAMRNDPRIHINTFRCHGIVMRLLDPIV